LLEKNLENTFCILQQNTVVYLQWFSLLNSLHTMNTQSKIFSKMPFMRIFRLWKVLVTNGVFYVWN